MAQNQGIPQGWESYLDRPDILTLPLTNDSSEPSNWSYLKPAHFAFVAFLLEMYPGEHIYFLARDAEYLYDVARLATQGTLEASRVHLLNVSTVNVKSPHLAEYLADNGITEEALKGGKKVLFVDTGFAGTIPLAVAKKMSPEAQSNFHTHLIQSEDVTKFPESQTFLTFFEKRDNILESKRTSLVDYEYMPRFSDRSTKYALIDGHYHPLSPLGQENDGTVSKDIALSYMRSIKRDWQVASSRQRFNYERTRFRYFKKIVDADDAGDTELIRKKQEVLQKYLDSLAGKERILAEAGLSDVLAASEHRGRNVSLIKSWLRLSRPSELSQQAKKILSENPEMKKYLLQPEAGIRLLFKTENWSDVEFLLGENLDSSVSVLLGKHLLAGPAQGKRRELQLKMLKDHPEFLTNSHLADGLKRSFKGQESSVLQYLFDSRDVSKTLQLLEQLLNSPLVIRAPDFVERLVTLNSIDIDRVLAKTLRSSPENPQIELFLSEILLRRGSLIYAEISKNPFLAQMPSVLQKMIDSRDPVLIHNIRKYILTAEAMPQLPRHVAQVMKLTAIDGRYYLYGDILKSAQPAKLSEAIRYYIENQPTKELLQIYMRAVRENADVPDLYRAIIERASPKLVEDLKKYDLIWKQYAGRAEYDLLRQSLDLTPAKRKAFLSSMTGAAGTGLTCGGIFL